MSAGIIVHILSTSINLPRICRFLFYSYLIYFCGMISPQPTIFWGDKYPRLNGRRITFQGISRNVRGSWFAAHDSWRRWSRSVIWCNKKGNSRMCEWHSNKRIIYVMYPFSSNRVDGGWLSHIVFEYFCSFRVQYLGRLWYAKFSSELRATIEHYRISFNRNTMIVNEQFIRESHLWQIIP